jgi:hypothetical protein
MDDIYYLVHSTDKDPSDFKVLKKTPCKDAENGGQFPGVFMTLVTKHNIDTERYFPGKYIMIFSKELLKQNNYHISLMDCNGMVTEHITYYPWNIDDAIKEMKKKSYGRMNEVVFHDEIGMEYLCKTVVKPKINVAALKTDEDFNIFKKLSVPNLLPRKQMKTDAKPDMTKLPFYCYTNEDNYDGVPAPPKSSLDWFQLLVKVANIDKVPDSIQGCINALRKKSVYLCNHREEQNIQLLKEYTTGKRNKRNTTRKNSRKSKTRKV